MNVPAQSFKLESSFGTFFALDDVLHPPGSSASYRFDKWFVSKVPDDTASGDPGYRDGHTSIGTGGLRQLTTDGTADSGSNSPHGTILINIGTPTQTNTGASGRAFRRSLPASRSHS